MDTSLNIQKSPNVLLLFTAITLLLALAFRPLDNADIQEITMYSIPLGKMVWIIPILLISLWLFYSGTQKFIYSRPFIWICVLGTVILTILIVTIAYMVINPTPFTIARHEIMGDVMQILSILFVLGQLIYLFNVVSGILSRKITN